MKSSKSHRFNQTKNYQRVSFDSSAFQRYQQQRFLLFALLLTGRNERLMIVRYFFLRGDPTNGNCRHSHFTCAKMCVCELVKLFFSRKKCTFVVSLINSEIQSSKLFAFNYKMCRCEASKKEYDSTEHSRYL